MQLNVLRDNDFDKTIGETELPQLVYFWAPWCKSAEIYTETLSDLAKTYEGRLEIHCMNIDENANVPASLGIKTIPQISLIENGVITSSLSGRHAKIKIREFLESQL